MKRFEILFRKFMLYLLLLFKKKAKALDIPEFTSESKFLFIRLNRIGDALVSTPLLKLIKEKIGCKIYVLASSSNYFIFDNHKIADELIVFNKNARKISSLVKTLNDMQFDAVFDLHDDISTTVSYLIGMLKCNFKFGLKKGTEKLYTHTIKKLDPSKHHIVDRTMQFTEFIGLKYDRRKTNIFYSPTMDSIEKCELFLDRHFRKKHYLIGINISAGSDARFWGIENYRKLLSSVLNYEFNVVILCVEKDLSRAMSIAGNLVPIYYNPVFDEFAAMVKQLNFLITPDTSIVHIASAFQIPMFGLYVKYHTDDMIWSPFQSVFECVVTENSNLESIKFETVNDIFIPFLEKSFYEYSTKNNR